MKKNVLTFVSILFASSMIGLFGISCGSQQTNEETESEDTVAVKAIGIQLWSLKKDMKNDPRGTIEKVGKIGYKTIEAAGYNDGKFYGMEPTEFKTLVENNGMKFISSHTAQALPDSTKWDSTMMWWDKCISAHKAAGVKQIIQAWMGDKAFEDMKTLTGYCKYFEAIGEKCNQAGIRFGFHNHAKEFDSLENVIIYDYMLQNTDPQKVMYQMDLYWVMKGGKKPIDYINKYPGRFVSYHVKDEAEVGASGKMDFKTPFENAETAGMENYFVEIEKYNFEPIVSAEKSFQYLMSAEYVK